MSDVIDDISERINIFHMCTYKSLIIGAKTLEIIIISDYQAYGLLLQMLSMNVLTHFLILCINVKYSATNRKKNSFTIIQDNKINVPVYCTWSSK